MIPMRFMRVGRHVLNLNSIAYVITGEKGVGVVFVGSSDSLMLEGHDAQTLLAALRDSPNRRQP
jgi:hypothetical protein